MVDDQVVQKLLDIVHMTLTSTESNAYKTQVSIKAIELLQKVVSRSNSGEDNGMQTTSARTSSIASYGTNWDDHAEQDDPIENGPFSYTYLLHFVTVSLPMESLIQSVTNTNFSKEVRDIALEIEGSVVDTISCTMSRLGPDYEPCKFHLLPIQVQNRAFFNLQTQLSDLCLILDTPRSISFLNGLLASRWDHFICNMKLSLSSLGTSSSSTLI